MAEEAEQVQIQGGQEQARTQIVLKTDERSIHLEPERERKFAAKSSDWHRRLGEDSSMGCTLGGHRDGSAANWDIWVLRSRQFAYPFAADIVPTMFDELMSWNRL